MKLRSHLIILVVAALLPVVIFAGVMIVVFSKHQQAVVERGLLDTARALSIAVDRELEASIEVLQTLATSQCLDSGDLKQCYDQAMRLLRSYRRWEAILLFEPSGQQIVNTRRPFGSPLPPIGTTDVIKEVVQTAKPVVSNLYQGQLARGPIISIDVPVIREGKVKYVMAASASPAFLTRLLAQQKIPPDWLATIIDRNQIVIARTRDSEKFLGKPEAPSFVANGKEAKEITSRGVTLDGVEVYSGLTRSNLSGWTVGLAAPVSAVEAPVRRSLLITAGGGFALLLLGIVLATSFGRRIATSIASLSNTAEALLGEDPAAAAAASGGGQQIAEVRQVARAIEDAGSKRKEVEEEIRRLAKFSAENPSPVMRIARNGAILYANQSSAPILTTWEQDVGEQAPDSCHEQIATALDSGISKEIELECNGQIFSCILAPIVTEQYVTIYGRDITERKRAEDKLCESEEKLRLISETLDEVSWMADPAISKILHVSAAYERVWGRSCESLYQNPISFIEAIHPEDRTRVLADHEIKKLGQPFDHEYRIIRPDGEIRYIWDRGYPVRDAHGQVRRYVGVAQDITERKQAEDLIQASLTEKETLLREIHHRVKNNLQLVASLLNLQAGYVKDEESRGAFRTSQNRIYSMALIHEKLYGSRDLVHIDFAAYVRGLAVDLFVAYAQGAGAIDAKVNAEGLFLSLDTAISCGLILNELISNALKHAFPAGRAGEIRVDFRQDDEGRYTLAVANDGVAFPADLDWRNTKSLGLQLVMILVNQLGGTIELRRDRGTEFKIIFRHVKGKELRK